MREHSEIIRQKQREKKLAFWGDPVRSADARAALVARNQARRKKVRVREPEQSWLDGYPISDAARAKFFS
jgi:hypothetical protein